MTAGHGSPPSPDPHGIGRPTPPDVSTATGAEPADDGFLRAAAVQLRDEPVDGWTDVSAAIKQRLKTVVRRSRPLEARTDAGHTMFVADRVVVAYLRQAIDAIEHCELDRVALVGEDDTCTGAAISIVSRYGHDYQALADQVRSAAYEVFRTLLGPTDPPFGLEGVDVTVTDLTDDED